MSTLLTDELRTTLTQRVSATRNLQVDAMHLHLRSSGSPAGSLFVDVRDTAGGIIATSSAVAVNDILTDADAANSVAHYHGLVRFLIDVNLQSGQSYDIVLKSTGYTYGASDFIGWCRDFDHLNQDGLRRSPVSYEGAVGYESPFDFVVHIKSIVRKGRR